MFFSSPPALVCAVATQDVTPLHVVLLELAAKSEALALTLTEKNERVLLLARCGAIRKYAGDNAGAAARAAEAKALIPTFNTNEDGALDHATLAIGLFKAGDLEGAATQFAELRKSAEGSTLESLKFESLRELAQTYHSAGDDKAARALLRTIAPNIKRVDGAASSFFILTVYNLADYGDPDAAEQLAPQLGTASSRATALRKVAQARKNTNLAQAKTTLRRALAISLADKDKTPGLLHGHIGAMASLGMQAEAKALTEKLPTLFPKKTDKDELLQMRVTCYGALGLFPQAIQLAATIPGIKQNTKLSDLMDQAIEQKNEPVLEQLIQKLTTLARKDPGLKADPNGEAGLTLLFTMVRLGSKLKQGKLTETATLLRSIMTQTEKLPVKDAKEKAELPLGLAELAIETTQKKG